VRPFVRMLGGLRIEAAGEVVEPPLGKAVALLTVLAARGAWVERGELVYLLWPDHDEEHARANLRKILSRNVPALPFAAAVETESSRLRWLVENDVASFRRALAAGQLTQALGLYRGPFLAGIRPDSLPEFEAWVDLERATLAAAWRDAGIALAARATTEGHHENAARLLRSMLEVERLDEGLVRAYLAALIAAGRRDDAEVAFLDFASRLDTELGLRPAPETADLLRAPASTRGAATPAGRRGGKIVGAPRPTTRFMGREQELRALLDRLADPECRLLTVTGPAGSGKTRLALRVAEDVAAAAGAAALPPVAHVAMRTIERADAVPFALADALGITIAGPRDPLAQVLEALAEEQVLLVLDDINLAARDRAWLLALLEGAPGVRVLATARRPLEVAGEWRFALRGLALDTRDGAHSEAATFFLEAAARNAADAAAGATPAAVERLCTAVGGLPLALEIAAGWLGTLTIEELVADLEQGGERLRSAAGVDANESAAALSLDRLDLEVRAALEGLSVFPGAFDLTAAQRVAGAGPDVLRELVVRGLVASDGTGTFRVHEVLRRIAGRHLAAEPKRDAAVRDAHASLVLARLEASEGVLDGGGDGGGGKGLADVLARLDADRDGIGAAFHWLVGTRSVRAVARMGELLRLYFEQRTRYAEGARLFAEAAEAFESDSLGRPVAAGLRVAAAWLEFRQGAFARAADLVADALPVLDDDANSRSRVAALSLCGALAGTRGDYDEAWTQFDRALSLVRAADAKERLAPALIDLAIAEAQLGLASQAEAHHREALDLHRTLGRGVHVARGLHHLGRLLVLEERHHEAEAVLQEALALARALAAEQVVPNVLEALARAALARGDAGRAREFADEAARCALDSGARHSALQALETLALAAAAEGDHDAAANALAAAVEQARSMHGGAVLVAALASAGTVAARAGRHREAIAALSLVRTDPRLAPALRRDLGAVWRDCARSLGAEAVATTAAEAARAGLDDVLARFASAGTQHDSPARRAV
jgi:DNA-binding SARP family transcriptional activator/predicted ATPase